jgi:2-polyprenyl-3-methyl-5-hydroxy-6-metoxy-1,4-benzoquinol methylase
MIQRETFTDDEAASGWNDGAAAFDTFIESGADFYRLHVHGPALLEACEPLHGARVLDLGCGQGFFSRQLAGRGAHVVAVDLSRDLIDIAFAREAREPGGIEYRLVSAAAVADVFEHGSFDLVTACMSIQDMADIPGVFRAAHTLLRPSGRFVFSIPHPATETPYRAWERDESGNKLSLKLDRYFESGPAISHWNMPRLTRHWRTPYWRHTLSEWLSMLHEAGFVLRDLREPRATAEQVAADPRLDDCRRMPYFLIVGVHKTS